MKKKKNMNFIWLHNKKIYNSGYSIEIVNEQCNTGDPLETSGGLYRGPHSMLIYVNTIKCCACETLKYGAMFDYYECQAVTVVVHVVSV